MKIAICTLRIGEEYQHLTRITLMLQEIYGKKHGYTLINQTTSLASTRTPHWSKMPLILETFENGYDFVVWMDADMNIMNFDIKLEDYISKLGNYDMAVTQDWKMTNTGFMVLRNCDWTKEFLKTWFEHKDYPEIGNYEQDAFQDLHSKNILNCFDHIKVLELADANAYHFNFAYGDFLIHFAGCRGYQIEIASKDYCLLKLENESDEAWQDRVNHLKSIKGKKFA